MAVEPIGSRRRIGDTFDRISELPDSVCHHILSFLTAKHAGRALFLSMRWRSIWLSSSIYDFDERHFQYFRHYKKFWSPDSDTISCSNNFLSLLEETLLGRQRNFNHLGIEKFTIRLSRASVDTPVIFNWIVFAVQRNVQELIITNSRRCRHCTIDSTFADIVFNAKNITKLEFAYFRIEETPSDFTASLPCLQELVLAHMWMTDSALRKLFSGCPVLKKLYLDSLLEPGTITVSVETVVELNLRRLTYSDVVVTNQPNLKSLVYTGSSFDGNGINIKVRNLRSLVLKDVTSMNGMVDIIVLQNPHLESLSLQNCEVEKLVIVSTKLESLSLSRCKLLVNKITIQAPWLRELKYCGKLANFSSVVASPLLEASINLLSSGHKSSTFWYAQLKDLCKKLQNAQVLYLICSEDLDLIIPRNIRISLLPQARGLKHLKVRVLSSESHGDELEEGLRWIFPCLTTLEISHK